MGNTIFIEDRRVCVKPLRSRLEAIKKLKPSVIVKGCGNFAGMLKNSCNLWNSTLVVVED